MEFLITISTIVAIYTILALALNLQYGQAGILNFGVAGFFLIGAYCAAIVTASERELDVLGGVSVVGQLHWPFMAGLVAAIAVTSLVAAAIAIPTLRLRGDYLAIVTIGLAEVVRWVAINETWLTRGPQGIRNIPNVFAGADHHRLWFLGLVLTVALAAYLLGENLARSGFGRVLRGVREDEDVTQALGKRTYAFKLKAFVLGAGLCGAAGSMWAHFAGAVQPGEFGPDLTFLVWACVLVGGRGNSIGVVVGTVLIVGLFEQGTRFLPSIAGWPQAIPALRLISIGILLLLTLRFRPQGVLPARLHSSRELAGA